MEVSSFFFVISFLPFRNSLLLTGHYERKLKHLNNQKESKRKMKRVGSVELPQEAFYDILSNKK